MVGGGEAFTPVNYLTGTECMEQLQEGYVASVSATAGCLYNKLGRDSFGFDALIVNKKEPPHQESSIFVQLKCTTTVKPDARRTHFSFRLKKREYFERLAAGRTYPKAILIVMATTPDQRLWTQADHEALTTSHCCYWVSMEGMEVPAATQPIVKVPIANRFDANALLLILKTIDEGGDLRGGT